MGYPFDEDAPPIINQVYREHPEHRELLMGWMLHVPHPSFWREYARLLHHPRMQAEALGALPRWAAHDPDVVAQVSELVWRQSAHQDPNIAFAASIACATLLHGGEAAWHRAASVLKGWRENQPESQVSHLQEVGQEDMTAGLSLWARVQLNKALEKIGAQTLFVFPGVEVTPPSPDIFVPRIHDINRALKTARELHGASPRDTKFFASLYAKLLREQPWWAALLPEDEAVDMAREML